jgi:hypothetical protein
MPVKASAIHEVVTLEGPRAHAGPGPWPMDCGPWPMAQGPGPRAPGPGSPWPHGPWPMGHMGRAWAVIINLIDGAQLIFCYVSIQILSGWDRGAAQTHQHRSAGGFDNGAEKKAVGGWHPAPRQEGPRQPSGRIGGGEEFIVKVNEDLDNVQSQLKEAEQQISQMLIGNVSMEDKVGYMQSLAAKMEKLKTLSYPLPHKPG